MPSNNPKFRLEDIVVQELKDEILIYDLKINKAYCLNQISALVWQLCDGHCSASDISRSLSRKLKTPIPEEMVWLALDKLKQNNLLDKSKEIEIEFNELTRREIVKKVGLASLVALPVVMTIIAPTAVQAASTCVNPGGIAGGQPVGITLTRENGGNCAANSPTSLSAICNLFYASSCCNNNAVYDEGTCQDTGPTTITYDCVCS